MKNSKTAFIPNQFSLSIPAEIIETEAPTKGVL